MAIDTPRTIGAVLGSVAEVSVTPTVTAGLYAANNILGLSLIHISEPTRPY